MTVMTVGRERGTRRLAVCGAVLLLAGLAAPPAARAEQVAYPPGAFSLSLNLSVVEPGATVRAHVAGCDVGVTIQLGIPDTSVSTSATCAAADFVDASTTPSVTLTFQAPSTVGVYTVRASELGGQGRSATALLTVAGVSGPTTTAGDLPPTDDGDGSGGGSGGALPKTGSDTAPLVATAGAAVLLGGGLGFVARRRRQRPSPAA